MIMRTGETAALITALCWAITAISFENASKKIGSLSVNFMRLIMALIMLSAYLLITTGIPWPMDAGLKGWIWLSLSGFIGLFLGDLFLFRAFVMVGARISMLIFATVPILTGIISFIFLGEVLLLKEIAGMLITVSGIILVVTHPGHSSSQNKKRSGFFMGILYAFLGATGQAAGLIMTKFGMADYPAFSANMIRILAASFCFIVLMFSKRQWKNLHLGIKNKQAMMLTTSGAVFGPFIGVSLSLVAIKYTTAGVASTIMAIVPVLIIPFSVYFNKEKVYLREIFGSVLAVSGVGILFL